MSQMFRCPSCKDVIRTDQLVCQYCNLSIDGATAHAEVMKFKAGIDACAAANHIKSLNYGAPLLLLLEGFLLFSGTGDHLYSQPRIQTNGHSIQGQA
jgi:hypothetical protein